MRDAYFWRSGLQRGEIARRWIFYAMWVLFYDLPDGERQWRTQKISWGGFIQWNMVVICLCAVFVTSQFDVIFMFPNQRFGEVCWHNMHILLHALPLFYVSLH